MLEWTHWDLLQLCLILIYSISFALQYYEMPLSAEYTLFAVRCALTVVFVADTAMRVAVHGIRFAPNEDIFGMRLHWAELLLNAGAHRLCGLVSRLLSRKWPSMGCFLFF